MVDSTAALKLAARLAIAGEVLWVGFWVFMAAFVVLSYLALKPL